MYRLIFWVNYNNKYYILQMGNCFSPSAQAAQDSKDNVNIQNMYPNNKMNLNQNIKDNNIMKKPEEK